MNGKGNPRETRIYSPATILKRYLEAMGIWPVLKRQPLFSREVLGYAMTAYFGGRAECRIRRTVVPVTYVDFMSMYPTVMSLMNVWQLVICEHIDVVDDTEAVRGLVEQIGTDDCFEPAIWQDFLVLVEIEPQGDILPVRAAYEKPRQEERSGMPIAGLVDNHQASGRSASTRSGAIDHCGMPFPMSSERRCSVAGLRSSDGRYDSCHVACRTAYDQSDYAGRSRSTPERRTSSER